MIDRIRTASAEHTRALGAALSPLLRAGDVIVLSGDLGAGKTVLVKGVAEGLGVAEAVTSPTFGLLAVHPGRVVLYHFDLYRLDDEAQLEDVAFYETLEGDGASFVEWGDRFPASLPASRLDVAITLEGDTERVVTLCPRGERGQELAEGWLSAWEAQA